MILTPTYSQSVDYWFTQFQNRFYYNYMLPVLGLNDANSFCCGRVNRNNVEYRQGSGYIPEIFFDGEYLASNGQSVRGGLFFETGKFVSFFGDVSRKRQSNGQYIGRFEFIILTDMSIITPAGITSSTQRLDEILLSEIETFVTVNGCGFKVVETTFDIDKVLERYSGEQKRNSLTRNMSDSTNTSSFCALKLILEIPYDPANSNGNIQPFQNVMNDITLVLFIKTTPDPTKVISVGNGVYVYQEYAEGDTLTVTRTDNGKPYIAGHNVQMVTFCNVPDTLTNMISTNSSGVYDRTGQGDPYGFLDGNYIAIQFTNIN